MEKGKTGRSISSLRDVLKGTLYIYLKDEETCRKFYEDATEEGFRFGKILPVDSPTDDIIAVDEEEEKQLGHVGYIGHMKFHNPGGSEEEFHRVDYAKYAAGEKEFYICSDGSSCDMMN